MSPVTQLRQTLRSPLGRGLLRPFLRILLRRRRAIRNSEIWLIVIAGLIATVVGTLVASIHLGLNFVRGILFDLPPGVRLSAVTHASSFRLLAVPVVGAILLGATRHFMNRERAGDMVDPIEANALRGGEMSLKDSVRLLISTMMSNLSGASVGMEAGYTQIGAALFSVCGGFFRMRREDRRIFVTAGTAAAIAAAFNAPLAGAFYGFELVQGGYSLRALAPVALAALVGTSITSALGAGAFSLHVAQAEVLPTWLYACGLALGFGAAFVGIFTMRAASLIETALRMAEVPVWFRPIFASVILGIVAMGSPQVMGAGQGAIQFHFDTQWDMAALIVLLFAKIAASAICIGSGFRGGLFSTSLLIGCLFGGVVSDILFAVAPSVDPHYQIFCLMGMAAVGASIIGAPLTMTLLVLESTSDLGITLAVLSGVLAASVITRIRFGYSFATWRFHLRGMPLRGAHDVGWMRDLTAERLMRRDAIVVPVTASFTDLRAVAARENAARLFVAGTDGQYAGAIAIPTLYDPAIVDGAGAMIAGDLASGRDSVLVRTDDIQAALKKFDTMRVEILPVVNSLADRRVAGYLTEALALRRYAEELERHRSAELGMPTVAG